MEHSRYSSLIETLRRAPSWLPQCGSVLAPDPALTAIPLRGLRHGRGRFFGIHAEAALQTSCLSRDVAIPLRFAASEVLEGETSHGSRVLGTGSTRPGTPRMGGCAGIATTRPVASEAEVLEGESVCGCGPMKRTRRSQNMQ